MSGWGGACGGAGDLGMSQQLAPPQLSLMLAPTSCEISKRNS